jgi:hypothetical protein
VLTCERCKAPAALLMTGGRNPGVLLCTSALCTWLRILMPTEPADRSIRLRRVGRALMPP